MGHTMQMRSQVRDLAINDCIDILRRQAEETGTMVANFSVIVEEMEALKLDHHQALTS
jgi:hypothetical protein